MYNHSLYVIHQVIDLLPEELAAKLDHECFGWPLDRRIDELHKFIDMHVEPNSSYASDIYAILDKVSSQT